MRIVRQAQLHGPKRCAVLLRNSDPEGFIETGHVLSGWDQEVFISLTAVREMARMIGYVSPEEIDGHLSRLQEMEAELAQLREQVDQLTAAKSTLESIQG